MAPIENATLNYSPSKTCFLLVPPHWIKHGLPFQDVPIFKLEYGEGKKAYFSGKGSFTFSSNSSEAMVYLNGKYAMALHLKDKDQVLIQKVESSPTKIEKLFLEPVNSDDWEIMELNAATVEMELLNQIRIVSKKQEFPVWIDNNSFYVKVVDLAPDVEPGMLAEHTEVHIIPKERKSKVSRKKKDINDQYKHLRKRDKGVRALDTSIKSSASEDSPSSSQDSGIEKRSEQSFSILHYFMKSIFANQSPIRRSPRTSISICDFEPLGFNFHLRVISFSKGRRNQTKLPLSVQSTTAFISERTFLAHTSEDSAPGCFVARISRIDSPLQVKLLAEVKSRESKSGEQAQKDKDSGNQEQFKSVCVTVIVLKSIEEEFDVPEALFRSNDFICVPLELKRRLSIGVTNRVHIQSVHVRPYSFDTILLYPLDHLHVTFNIEKAISEFKNWAREALLDDSSIVLSDGCLVKLPSNKSKTCDFIICLSTSDYSNDSLLSSPVQSLSLSSSSSDSEKSLSSPLGNSNYGFLNLEKLGEIEIKLGSHSPHLKKLIWRPGDTAQKEEGLHQHIPAASIAELGGIKEIAKDVLIDFDIWFKLTPLMWTMQPPSSYYPPFGSMLVTGPKGVGKSSFVMAMCKELINYPHYIFILAIKCLPLRGKRVETIVKKFELSVLECIHRQPSVLVFENLDDLARAPSSLEQETGPDGLYYYSIAQVLISLLDKIIVSKHNVVVIATAQSTHSLHPDLARTKGRKVFQQIVDVKPPNENQRCEILKSLMKARRQFSTDHMTEASWTKISKETHGYVAQDLQVLVDRAIHASWVRTRNCPPVDDVKKIVYMIEEDFEFASQGYTPISLRNVELHKGSNKSWRDIGGLHDVKTAIQQILTWPTKYRDLFKNFSLKPSRNILLYGPPGTGKTLVAGVVANECGLNFISIKGPELLSKFIGASELAVRDLFVRATSAKPCILFFDEFDALAPRRGHDNTGVTDRVVNQLLTQMDGVESLEGVYVLAATSQPDLIDPALLRPGRLDKCLHCPLPNEIERQEILTALTSKMSFNVDVDFKYIASKTDYFSGADLQGLLYSAQIKAFHDIQNLKKQGKTLSKDTDYSEIADNIVIVSYPEGVVEPYEEGTTNLIPEVHELIQDIQHLGSDSRFYKTRKSSVISAMVEQKHLMEALNEAKPSVSLEQRLRYEKLYRKFQQSGGTDFSVSLSSDVKKLTLA